MRIDPSTIPPFPPQFEPPIGNPTPPTRAQWIAMAALAALMAGEIYYVLHLR